MRLFDGHDQPRDATTAADGTAAFADLAPGSVRGSIEAAGFATASIPALRLGPDEGVRLDVTLGPEASRVTVAREPAPYRISFDAQRLRDLPSSGAYSSLVETADSIPIADRISGGGFYPAEPALLGIHGSSWTQTTLQLGDVDVGDPDRGGTPLLIPDPAVLEDITADSALVPPDAVGPGPILRLTPRRPEFMAWHGAASGALTTSGMQSASPPGPPPVARFGSWADAGLVVSGPLARDRVGLLVAARTTRARRFELADPTELTSDLSTLWAHLVAKLDDSDELRVLGAFQDVTRPFAGRARLSNRDATEGSRAIHLQGTWQRRGERGWSLTGSYQRATLAPDGPLPTGVGTVERIFDGPVAALPLPADQTRERWGLSARAARTLGRHALRGGVSVDRATVTSVPLGGARLTAETLNRLPARLWDFGPAGTESRIRRTELAGFVADRMSLPGRIGLEAGVRFDVTSASADGGGDISWNSLSPRLHGRWRLRERGATTFFGGYGRYAHQLPLRVLSLTAPGLDGSVHHWNDDNENQRFEQSERGTLVTRLGPATVDPGLQRPRTTEFVAGLEWRWGSVVGRFTGVYRRERQLVETVNVGVPPSRYNVYFVPDPSGDILGPKDDQLLPIYDRLPASFGKDRYILANRPDLTELYESVELILERPFGGRFDMLLGMTASKSTGSGGNRGFKASENDQGVVGELYDDPNADTQAYGRLFFDRAYTIKIAGSYRAPGDVRLGVVTRYQDGQPFSRLVIVPDLRQGPEAIEAIYRGRARFTYTLTMDARIEKGVSFGSKRLAAVVEGFNVIGLHNEVEEDIVSGPAYRTVTVVQPPRSFRVGLRLEF